MHFKIDRNLLLKSLSHIQGVVERRNTIPILSNVKIEAENAKLQFTATDMDVAVTDNIEAEILKTGSITVPAHTFHDIVKKLPDEVTIDCIYDQENSNKILQIAAAQCNFTLPVIEANDFPIIETGEITHQFTIQKNNFLKLLDKSKFAISTEETRYYLNGIFLHDTVNNSKNVLRAVATDGHRLARVEVDLPEGAKDMPKIIIPRKTILEIKKFLDENIENKEVKIYISASKIKFEFANITLISKLIDGNFPDYERVIPTNNNHILKTEVKPLTTAIDRVSTISSEKGKAVKLTLGDNKLILSADNIEVGYAKEEINVDYSHALIETGFNSKYLIELTSVLDGETAEFHFSDGSSPTLVQDSSDLSSLFVIMPMRI
ncbi:MAG: DNA polymerase III subunit beta [Rickettsiales bacterium]